MFEKNYPQLHVFLGAGGVGKTTLAASFAVSLANSGRKVGLLSIDPAKRLRSAFGVETMSDVGDIIPTTCGELRAATLNSKDSLLRWVKESVKDKEKENKILSNPYFLALANKLASSSDILAAVRIAEWIELFPDIDDLVIDTAPGMHALDFINKPEKVTEFLDSKLIEWIRAFVGHQKEKSIFQKLLSVGAKKVIEGLSVIGGNTFLVSLGEFLYLLEDVFTRVLQRLNYTRGWLRHRTNFILVTAVRDDAAFVTKELIKKLRDLGLKSQLIVVNKAISPFLKEDPAFLDFLERRNYDDREAALFARFLSSYNSTQEKVNRELSLLVPHLVELPKISFLDSTTQLRLSDLAILGDLLRKKAGSAIL